MNVNHKEVDTGVTGWHFVQYGMSTLWDEGNVLLMGLDCKNRLMNIVYMLYCIKIFDTFSGHMFRCCTDVIKLYRVVNALFCFSLQCFSASFSSS